MTSTNALNCRATFIQEEFDQQPVIEICLRDLNIENIVWSNEAPTMPDTNIYTVNTVVPTQKNEKGN